MEIIQGTTDFQLHTGTAVALGKFDGIHIGHRRLLAKILEQKAQGLKACVLTFQPTPAVFFGLSDGRELTGVSEKRKAFARMGVDVLIEFPLNARTAAIPPEEFVREYLTGKLCAKYIAAGEDLSFGRGGAGDAALMRRLGGEIPFTFDVIEKVRMDGAEVSSSRIRACVEAGRMEEAERLLGAPYGVSGIVIPGHRIGRTIGFPTVNLCPESGKLLPPNGVYFSLTHCGRETFCSISNVGCKPTISDREAMGVESYLYDFHGNLYGRELEVELLAFHRPERRFADVEALRAQLEEDIRAGERYHAAK
ncbi:MAG: riboflavin biosynthesis protein RibF [Clostridium sp.]|nr:riboflavin biosynthesis protein RibF [Acetatifactor muris]MCM1527937.1 riboflavin biosynthesis protein RibF [Bacteroides sp.]MCM1564131.1 riboflavin biosynthesis protein RibF [Clostridium sp.]